MDLRIEKTRKSIHNAFIALRARKPLEKITVKELCEQAWIHKSTFYSHYSDLYDLSEHLENHVVDSIIQALPCPEELFEEPAAFTRALFTAYLSQDALARILFSGSRRGQLISKMESRLRGLVFHAHPEYKNDPLRNIQLTYTIYGSYYAFAENRRYGEELVTEALSRLTQAALSENG